MGPAFAARPALEHDLYLEVFVNGAPTNLIGAFRRRGDGRLSISADELRELGLRPDAAAVGSDGMLELDQLPGATYRVDERRQSIRIDIRDGGRLPRVYDLRKSFDESGTDAAPPLSGGVLNYLLFASTENDLENLWRIGDGYSVAASLEGRLFGPLGVLSQTAIVGSRRSGGLNTVRLDTTWTLSDPVSLVTYRAGDTISGSLAWTRPVRLAGLQIQRNFSLRPDLVTAPLPSLRGSAAVPSTVDVYVNNLRTFSRDLPAGPFEIRNIPVVSGFGTQRIVVRDALGRETVTDQAFYASPKLLRAGLYDFSLDAGFPRRNYGLRSADYADEPMASASLRGGISDELTVEMHAEGSARLLNAGAGLVAPVGNFGVASVAVAGSTGPGDVGAQLAASLEAGVGTVVFHARTLRTFGDFADIATVSAQDQLAGTLKQYDFRPPRALDQVAFSFPLAFDPARVALTFTHVHAASGSRHGIVSATYSRPLSRELSFFASAFTDLLGRAGSGIYAGITRSFGDGVSATASASTSNIGPSFGVDAVKAQPNEVGSSGWRVRDREGAVSNRAVAASYRAPAARFQAGVEQFGHKVRASAEVEGAVVAADGEVFLANRVDDAFAIVDAGAPGVDVLVENRRAGKSGAHGKLLVTDLRAWQHNRIAIDPKSLPVDAEIASTRATATPSDRGGAKVSFGVETAVSSALVSFREANRSPVRAGARGILTASGTEFVVGYDGEAFVRNLAPDNEARITHPGGGVCHARFPFVPRPGTQVRIEGVPCI